MCIVTTFDNKFAESLPKEIHDNAKIVLGSGKLVVGSDHNSFWSIWHKLSSPSDNLWRIDAWLKAIVNTIINIWYFFLELL